MILEEKREKANKKSREWYAKNSEKAKAHTKIWRLKNPEMVKKNKSDWFQIPENRIKHILSQAKRRAISNGMNFDISIEDLLPLPKVCPVLGILINYKGTGAKGFINDSPSIDRINSSKGYIKGNVCIISWRANRIKSDATLDELIALIGYIKERQP